MLALNCLIIEDEPLAADVMRDYIQRVPGLNLTGICYDAFSAMEKLRSEKTDLLFLDINLPKLSGLDFIKTLRNNYHIILTTAYHQYAFEGYELNVADYLLKPIEFNRFLQAVNKVFARYDLKGMPTAEDTKYYFFNVDKTRVKIFADDILFIESLKDYVHIYTSEKKIITKFRIGEMEEILKDARFLRIHKSFIVNLDKISTYTSARLELEGKDLPIGRTYRKIVEATLKKVINRY